jgi:hypothetical protein
MVGPPPPVATAGFPDAEGDVDTAGVDVVMEEGSVGSMFGVMLPAIEMRGKGGESGQTTNIQI